MTSMDLVSGKPFWPIADGLIAEYPALGCDASCDVVVLGAGITGALVAQHLVDAGIDTIVVDKRDVAFGSTAASTALIQYELDTLLVDLAEMRGHDQAARAYLACAGAVERLGRLAARLSKPIGFARKKNLYFANSRDEAQTLCRELERRRSIGIEVDWLGEADIARRFAFRRPGALLSYDAAQVDPFALTHALFSDACGRGLRVYARTPASEVRPTDEGVLLRTDDDKSIRARHLVFASGYETYTYLKHSVAKLVSTYAIASHPVPSFDGWGEDRCTIWEFAHPYVYMRTTDDGRILVGGEDEDFRNPELRDRLISAKAMHLAERFGAMFPEIAFEPAYAWAGTFGETSDGLAYIGTHPDWPHAFFALGYGGNGITFSLLAAEIIRDAILGADNENADLFRFDR
jgi:glycine/D-amino acid oxidase-like deaminating enzyme